MQYDVTIKYIQYTYSIEYIGTVMVYDEQYEINTTAGPE